MNSLISFSVWPESVSYERSRGIRRRVLRENSARVCFGMTPLCQNSKIYAILSFFLDAGSEKCSCPSMYIMHIHIHMHIHIQIHIPYMGPGPAARPSAPDPAARPGPM